MRQGRRALARTVFLTLFEHSDLARTVYCMLLENCHSCTHSFVPYFLKIGVLKRTVLIVLSENGILARIVFTILVERRAPARTVFTVLFLPLKLQATSCKLRAASYRLQAL